MSVTWRTGLSAMALASVAVLATACSNAAPAGAAPTASSTASQSGALAYAECMRTHGEPNFPDPGSGGGFSISPSSGIDSNSVTFRNAQKACASLRGGGASGNSVTPGYLAKEVKFAQCMRAHGVSDFPDPNGNGGFSGTSTMNPQSPTFQDAQATCSKEAGLSSGGAAS